MVVSMPTTMMMMYPKVRKGGNATVRGKMMGRRTSSEGRHTDSIRMSGLAVLSNNRMSSMCSPEFSVAMETIAMTTEV